MAFRSAINSVSSVADSNEDQDENQNIDANGMKVDLAGAAVSALWAKKSGVNWAKDSFKKGRFSAGFFCSWTFLMWDILLLDFLAPGLMNCTAAVNTEFEILLG